MTKKPKNPFRFADTRPSPHRPANAQVFVDRLLPDGTWELVIPFRYGPWHPWGLKHAHDAARWLGDRHPTETYRVVRAEVQP